MSVADVKVFIKHGEEKKAQVEVNTPDHVSALVKAGQVVGEIVVKMDGVEVEKTQATAAQDIVQASFMERWWPFTGDPHRYAALSQDVRTRR